jgi:hypothetical protein
VDERVSVLESRLQELTEEKQYLSEFLQREIIKRQRLKAEFSKLHQEFQAGSAPSSPQPSSPAASRLSPLASSPALLQAQRRHGAIERLLDREVKVELSRALAAGSDSSAASSLGSLGDPVAKDEAGNDSSDDAGADRLLWSPRPSPAARTTRSRTRSPPTVPRSRSPSLPHAEPMSEPVQ